jgi:virginiamycin B lyase
MLEQVRRNFSVVLATVVVLACGFSAAAAEYTGVVQGVVKNSSGAPVAGAFVKLKNADRRLTFMVISQDQGRYQANHLPPGSYMVQGIGGEYQSQPASSVAVAEGKSATLDLSLTVQRAPALPNAWPGRTPGQGGGESESAPAPLNPPDGPAKQIVMGKCSVCHDAARIVNARYDRERWEDTIDDMQMYAEGSDYAKPLTDQESKTLLDYLDSNFSAANGRGGRGRAKPDPNSRLPRTLMQGDQRNYIAVEFELPDTGAEPHEVTVDNEGNGWVSQRTGGRLGRLDLKTLTYTEIDPPPAPSDKVRLNGIVRGEGNKIWFLDGGPNRRWLSYDTTAKEFNSFTLPKLKSGSASGNTMRVRSDGTVWLCSLAANQIIRLDPKTKQFDVWDVPAGEKAGKSANPYGMAISGDGKVWFVENALSALGRIDPATGKFDEYPIPMKDVVARKMGMDSEGNIWAGLHIPGKLMKVDYKTIKMTIFDPPTKDSGVYSVQGDPTSKLVWFSQQQADLIGRFDPATQKFTEFPLANAEEDHRRIEIDPNHPTRIWWSGDTSGRMGYIELVNGSGM